MNRVHGTHNLNLTDEQKKGIYDILFKLANEKANEEYYKEYDMSKTDKKTPCLNANYTNGFIHEIEFSIDELLGLDYLEKCHDSFSQKMETFMEKADEIYRI